MEKVHKKDHLGTVISSSSSVFLKKLVNYKSREDLNFDRQMNDSLSFQFFAYGKANNLVPIDLGPGDR